MGHTYPPMKIDGKWHDYEEIVKRPDCGPYDADGIERARAFLQKHGENMVVGAVNLYRLIVTADDLRTRLAAAEARAESAERCASASAKAEREAIASLNATPTPCDVKLIDADEEIGHYLAGIDTLNRDPDLFVSIRLIEQRVRKLIEQHNKAVEHDRQPYPTAWAYERACEALWRHRERADNAEAAVAVRDALLREAGSTILALRKACNPYYMALEPGCIENRIDTTLRGDATSAKEAPRG